VYKNKLYKISYTILSYLNGDVFAVDVFAVRYTFSKLICLTRRSHSMLRKMIIRRSDIELNVRQRYKT